MHRLGSVLNVGPVNLGPGVGPPTALGEWRASVPVDLGAKFVMIHLNGASMAAGDTVEIPRGTGFDSDFYGPAWGPDYWTRPIKGGVPIEIIYRSAGGAGVVTVDRYGRGEGINGNGELNTNADLFFLTSPYQEPSYYPPYSVVAGHSGPSWLAADCVADPVMKATAQSVGLYVVVDTDIHNPQPADGTPPIRLSSCTATLIAPDRIITAGHCLSTNEDTITGSFTLNWWTKCHPDGQPPDAYNPKFYKLKRLVKTGFLRPPGDSRPPVDYAIVELDVPAAGIGAPAIPFRPANQPLVVGEPLFTVHHRRGTPKKISRYPNDSTCDVQSVSPSYLECSCSVDFGSSGSSIFDAQGRIVANLSSFNGGASAAAIQADLQSPPPVTDHLDTVMVLDRSGSMALPGTTGSSKMNEAKQAAALFVSLLRATPTNNVGLVSFSTTSSKDRPLQSLGGPNTKADLDTSLGGLTPVGSTTIGGGLRSALEEFAQTPTPQNARAILLMTDGLENTWPFIADVINDIRKTNTAVEAIGFGTAASLDGEKLELLAHGDPATSTPQKPGNYTRATDGLALKKFFALSFGNIFDFGTVLDPEFTLQPAEHRVPDVPVDVCAEDTLVVIVGWEHPDERFSLAVRSPAGAEITSTSAAVIAATGETWAHLTVPLPFSGEREGRWQVEVTRNEKRRREHEDRTERLFVTALAQGGPRFTVLDRKSLYTGDRVTPRVFLRYPDGGRVDADVKVAIDAPRDGTGNLLRDREPQPPTTLDGDQLDQRMATLLDMEQSHGGKLIDSTQHTLDLFDDGFHNDGGMEPDGVYANSLPDILRHEGTYNFHARAVFGETCRATRETTWSVNVAIGIDPDRTDQTVEHLGRGPDGRDRARLTLTPRDRYGNYLGPGRRETFTVAPSAGQQLEGALEDVGGGAYSQVVVVDPGGGRAGIVLTQPGRGPIVISADGRGRQKMLMWLLLLLLAVLILAIAIIIVIEVT
jgi:von Willebrand factor type A domain/Trypsin-like peptidase domain